MQDVGFEWRLDFIPRKFILLLLVFVDHTRLHGVERYKGLVRYHAGERQSAQRRRAVIVVPVAIVRIVFDGENLFQVVYSGEGGGFESAGYRNDAVNPVGIACCKIHYQHSAEGRADRSMETVYTQLIVERDLGVDNIPKRNLREITAPFLAGFRVDGRGACGTVTAP